MKHLFLILFVFFTTICNAFAQVKEVTNSFPFYEHVVTSVGTPTELKAKVLNWSRSSIKKTELIIKEETSELLIIDGNSWISKGQMGVCPVTFHFNLKFEFREGRFKCTTNVTKAMVQDGMLPRYLDQFKHYCARPTNSPRREKEIEIFHQKLLTWLESIDTFSTVAESNDW